MKKHISTFVMIAMMAISVPMLAGSASAQTRRYTPRQTTSYTYKKPNFYRRHRNLINIGIGTGAGALLGGLIGGKKGALIGAAAGAGGSTVPIRRPSPARSR